MKKRIYLVTATRAKTQDEFSKRPIYKSLEKLYRLYSRDEFEFEVVKDNTTGLSTVYNRYITEEHINDIVLFVHDDIVIPDMFIVEHLRKSPYTVTGLAGTALLNLKVPKCAWHLMASNRESMRGEVRHIRDNRVWTTTFGPTMGSVVAIDGLFMAINIEKIINKKARFNETFNWHHYDIAFCQECVKDNVSIGVMPIDVIHYGLGDSMLSQEWENSNEKFVEVYCK